MTYVERRKGESLEKMLRRFRRKLQRSRLLSEYRRRQFFISKGEAERNKLRRAERHRRRRETRWRRKELRRGYN